MDGSDADTTPTSQPPAHLLEDPADDDFAHAPNRPRDGSDLGAVKRSEAKTDQAPAWTELKTKAGKERKRLPLACIQCRRKKVKCTGCKPSCSYCLKANLPCVYKPSERKAAPRTDYFNMLDGRMRRMESRVQNAVHGSPHDGGLPLGARANVRPALPGSHASARASKKRAHGEAFGPMRDLQASSKAHTRPKLPPPTPLPCEPRERRLVQKEGLLQEGLMQEGRESLPSPEMQAHLAGVYFEHVYGQPYHLLHERSYMSGLSAGTLPPVLLLSVCAVSARFSSHQLLASKEADYLRGDHWAQVARDVVTKHYDWPNMTILNCALLLGLHAMGTAHGTRSWALGGQALGMAIALQLHKNLDKDPPPTHSNLTFVDQEIRRRTMWACFMMDRLNSSGRDRPTFIKEETLQKLPLPCKEYKFRFDSGIDATTETLQGDVSDGGALVVPTENMGVAAFMVKTIAIWGRVIAHLNQGGREADAKCLWEEDSPYSRLVTEAQDIACSLPESLTYNADNLEIHKTEKTASQFVFLHVAIQMNILFLNRFAVSPASESHQNEPPPTAFVTEHGERAFLAANRISELLQDSEDENLAINAPFMGYCAFLSATVHVVGSHAADQTIRANSNKHLGTNQRYLCKLSQKWGPIGYLAEMVTDQYRKRCDDERMGRSPDCATAPIFQYGDWIDVYPNGMPQADSSGGHRKSKETGADAALEQRPDLHPVGELWERPTSSPGAPGRSNSLSSKRQASMAARHRASTGVHGHHPQQLQPLGPAFRAPITHLQHGNGNPYANHSFGEQTSGATGFGSGATGFDVVATGQHAMQYGPNLHMSPLSPEAVSHNQFREPQPDLFHPNHMLMQIPQPNTVPSQPMLDGPFGTPPGMNLWSNSDGVGEYPVHGNNSVPSPHGGAGPDAAHGNPHHTLFGHEHGPGVWDTELDQFPLDSPVGNLGGHFNALEFSSWNAAGNDSAGGGGT